MVKISDSCAVNPKHVMAVMFDSTKLQTVVVMIGMTSIKSDYSLYDTIEILKKGERNLEQKGDEQ